MGIFAKLFGKKSGKNNKERKNDYTPPICSATTSIKIETPEQKAGSIKQTTSVPVRTTDTKPSATSGSLRTNTTNASSDVAKGTETVVPSKDNSITGKAKIEKATEKCVTATPSTMTKAKPARTQKVAASKSDATPKVVQQKKTEAKSTEVNETQATVVVNENRETEVVKMNSAVKKAVVIKKKAIEKPTDTAKKTVEDVSDVAADVKADNDEKILGGCFEIKKTKDDRYVFNLYASNHVIVATSQVYSSSAAALNGIKSVMTNASKAGVEDQTLKDYVTLPYPKWEIYEDVGGKYRFRLSASNGSCICHSQGYTKKANCKGGIESIKKFAPGAKISKSYLKKTPN